MFTIRSNLSLPLFTVKMFSAKKVINKEKAHQLIAKFDTTEKVDAAFAELNQYWDNLLNFLSCLFST